MSDGTPEERTDVKVKTVMQMKKACKVRNVNLPKNTPTRTTHITRYMHLLGTFLSK